ncbi:tripartite tricarboxylate transporter permease [Agrobacterium larrymoorei]|uniref:Tripartite tricarboxylate transporter permease n=1 Tax=Agrobacterium larrymoorei TaxID=160699 RepID=A0A4D7DTZ2_9HYPH|nr:tripartite tricarboxylate transporter permease [Agrobacterium larrymoorei]QCI99968.1 tripartite tricarboxylate transporter permease [Agrobacterium larrymoorei]QYA09591.1 tripartite tricarboxylate transporter permease [Agrobacterium larrymoorei]WHA42994.1 tripartite tricarboxylate transporter permease [Agrobacterium larrymoorei]
MDTLSNLALGFSVALSLSNLTYCFLGVLLGTFIGVLPGVGPLVTIAVLLPLTFGLPPEGALIMLAGIYYGAAYGGSTTAILVNLPGESSAAVTCIDGYQMARKGKAGQALAIAALSSFVAGTIGTILIATFAPPLSAMALEFGPPEYFSMILMAMVFSSVLGHGSLLKGVLMALFGVMIGLVGTDVISGVSRFSFGFDSLTDRIDFAVVAMGLFAFAEIIKTLETNVDGQTAMKVGSLGLSRQEIRASTGPTLRGTALGSFFGVLPGAGQVISSFAAYMLEKKISKNPERFGTGAIEGVAAPEAANNAAAQTAFIPTLTLGIPGSATMALMLGALMIQGITPGPQVMTSHPSLFWGLIASMWIGNLLLVILNLPLVGLWVTLLRVPYRWLCPAILVFSCVGILSLNFRTADIFLTAGFGVLGYALAKLECPPAPFVLGFILGPMMEENLRRAMLFSRGDPSILITSPISAGFLAVTIILLIVSIVPAVRRRKDEAIGAE